MRVAVTMLILNFETLIHGKQAHIVRINYFVIPI